MMKRAAILSLEEVQPYLPKAGQIWVKQKPRPQAIIKEMKVFLDSFRYYVFVKNNFTCVVCNLEAAHWALERNDSEGTDETRYHLNLYGLLDGKEILFTKDHIVSRHKGGRDILDNFQTMCCLCNAAKNKKELAELAERIK